MCPHCHAQERHRLLAMLLDTMAERLVAAPVVVEFAPNRATRSRLKGRPGLYVGVDLDARLRPSLLGDITRIPLADGCVDLLVCYHVLEHVPDDWAAMAEIARILAPGGVAIISTPYNPRGVTEEDPSAPVEERVRRFGQHDHVRLYGTDMPHRMYQSGLVPSLVRPDLWLGQVEVDRLGLRAEVVWLCHRAAGAGGSTEAAAAAVVDARVAELEAKLARYESHPAIRGARRVRRALRRG
jgi:SAM-dependent methyltransferase